MTDDKQEGRFEMLRRELLRSSAFLGSTVGAGASATGLVGVAETSRGEPATDVAAASGSTYTVEQDGTEFAATAFSDPDETAEQFYEGTAAPGFGAADTSQLFVYEGSSGEPSLGVVHDGGAPGGGAAFSDDFDYDDGVANHGWTVVSGGFETKDGYLHPTTGVSTLRRPQTSAVGTFEFTGIQNDAQFHGLKIEFVGATDQFGGGDAYRLRVAQERFGTTELVRVTADGDQEVLVSFPDHSGEEFDVRIERDPETFAFTCFHRGPNDQSYTEVGTAEETDPLKASGWYVQRHDSGNQRIDGVTMGSVDRDLRQSLVVDDFNDGDLSEYDYTDHGTSLRTDLVYEGTHALELPSKSGSTSDSQCVSVSGAIPYPSRGDTFGGYLYQPDETNQFRYVFAAQSASKDPDGYNVAISGSREFLIEVDRRGQELARTSLDDVDHTGKWLEVVIDWEYDAGSGETTITATLNDKGPDGTRDDGTLVQIRGTDKQSVYESGGLAFNADAKGSSMAFDNATFFERSATGGEATFDFEAPPSDAEWAASDNRTSAGVDPTTWTWPAGEQAGGILANALGDDGEVSVEPSAGQNDGGTITDVAVLAPADDGSKRAGSLDLGAVATISEAGCENKASVFENASLETVTPENDAATVGAGARGSRSWQFDDAGALFEELFVLADADGNTLPSTEMEVVSGFAPVGLGGDDERDYPGVTYRTTLSGTLGDHDVTVDRTVLLDACRPAFDVEYRVSLQEADAFVENVRLYQYCDFDVGGCDGDVGHYDADGDVSYVEPAEGTGPTVGFTGVDRSDDGQDAVSDAHHVGQAPARDAVLSGDDRYPGEGSGDPAVAQAWDLGPLDSGPGPGGIDAAASITVRFGGAASPDDLEALLVDGDVRTLREVTELADVSQPPTAVETDEPVAFSVTLETCADPALYGGQLEADLDRRGTAVGAVRTDLSVLDVSGDTVELGGTIDPASAFTDRPEGVRYEITVELFAALENNVLETLDGEIGDTYAFVEVQSVGVVPGLPELPAGVSPAPTNDDLFQYLRKKAEFVNEHAASGLGTMGALGFDFHFLTQQDHPEITDGWLELDQEESAFEDGSRALPDNSIDFVEAVAEKTATELDVQFGAETSDYDTLFTMSRDRSQGRYSRPFYQGELFPDGTDFLMPVTFGTEGGIVRIPSELVTEHFPVSPIETPTGFTDAVYERAGGNRWRHELGHSMGPNNQVGLPDLYGQPPNHLGDIEDWGLMGGDGDTMTSFTRVWGGDIFSPREWLQPNGSVFDLRDEQVSLDPLTEKTLGDDTTQVTSVYANFTVDVGVGIDVVPVDFHVDQFYLEARKNFTRQMDDPDSQNVKSTPRGNPYGGVAIYKQDLFSTEDKVELERILGGESPIEIDDFVPTIDYLVNSDGGADRPTLTDQAGSDLESQYDTGTATKLELIDGVGSGPEVAFERDVVELLPPGVDLVVRLTAKAVDVIADVVDDTVPSGPALPPLEVVAETADGRRAGIDPETGEVVNEIEGATVERTGSGPTVSVPGDEAAEFTVSAARIEALLDELGVDPPDEITYERTVVIDDDPTVEEITDVAGIEAVPYIDGRVSQRSLETVGGDGGGRALRTADVDVEPERLNVKSNGKWVTAWIGLPGDVDVDEVRHASVLLGTVRAESDEQHGFVVNPPTRTQSDRRYVGVKFPRDEVIDRFGPGEHEPVVSGVIGETAFQGSTTIELFEPGKDRDGGRDSGSDRNGNDSNGDGNGK